MSDTTKLILWIVIALIVVAIIAWLLVRASRKRQEDARRREATSLRAQAKARSAAVTDAADRASVTGTIASEAQADAEASRARAEAAKQEALAAQERARAQAAEAEQRAAEAERLAGAAATHQGTADDEQARQDRLLDDADRVDPDVETPGAERDAEVGATRDDASPESPRTTSFGPGAAAFDDDEADLADAEDPFAAPESTGPGPADDTQAGPAQKSQDRAEDSTDDLTRDADSGAGDTRGTRPAAPPHDEGDEATSREHVFGKGPEFGDPTGSGDEPADQSAEADWVNGPVDEDGAVEPPESDSDVVDWINGPDEAEPVTIEIPDRRGAQPTTAGSSDPAAPSAPTQEVIDSLPEQPHAASAEADDDEGAEQVANEEYAGHDSDDPQPSDRAPAAEATSTRDAGGDAPTPESAGGRRISSLEEVVDGGHGVGSAAPIEDGAQPLGHAIKGRRDRMTFSMPGSSGYDEVEPDVWFYSEQAARDAGYGPAEEA